MKVNKPTISKELLEYLAAVFPNQCPSITDTDREIWAKVGAQTVVEHLKSIHDAQAKDALAAVLATTNPQK